MNALIQLREETMGESLSLSRSMRLDFFFLFFFSWFLSISLEDFPSAPLRPPLVEAQRRVELLRSKSAYFSIPPLRIIICPVVREDGIADAPAM